MAHDRQQMSREARLAAKLRENLHRRKAQARAQGSDGKNTDPAHQDENS